MRSLVIISTIIAATVALKCYQDVTTGADPTKTLICPAGTSQCFKQVSKANGAQVDLFGCDIPNNPAGGFVCSGISNGKCQNVTGNGGFANTCCCGTDLCNDANFSPPPMPPKSAGLFQPLLSIGVLVLGRVI